MALAFPGQTGPLWEIMARDAFEESLGDPSLRLRVLERDPETLEQALKLTSRSVVATAARQQVTELHG